MTPTHLLVASVGVRKYRGALTAILSDFFDWERPDQIERWRRLKPEWFDEPPEARDTSAPIGEPERAAALQDVDPQFIRHAASVFFHCRTAAVLAKTLNDLKQNTRWFLEKPAPEFIDHRHRDRRKPNRQRTKRTNNGPTNF